MKLPIVIILTFLAALTTIAWFMSPESQDNLSWVSDDNPARRAQIDLYNKLHPKEQVRLDPNNSGVAKVIVQSVGGVGPDLFDCYSSWDLAAYVKSGVAWDITDEIAKAGIDVDNDIWSLGQDTITYNDRIYGLPTNVVIQAMWFNKDIFDKHGIPYPQGEWTWEEFIPVAQKLTIRDKNGRATQFGLLFEWGYWMQFVWQWGGSIYNDDGTRCVIDSPQAIEAIQFMHDLIYKYKIMPSPADESMATQGGWGSGTISLFGSGKAATAFGGRWWLCTLRSYKNLRLGAVECPHGPIRVYYGGARATLINKNSPRRKEALEFVKYLASKDYCELINDQGDAIAPVKTYCYTDAYLHNPKYPQEDFNEVWRDTMKYGRSAEVSPFVNAMVAMRIINTQLDLVKNNQKTAALALKDAARQVNQEIGKNVEEDPELRARYERLMGRMAK